MNANHLQGFIATQGCSSIFPQNTAGRITLTTGTIFRNPGTETIVVSILNQDPNRSRTVTTSVLDWQNTCSPTELNKFAYLCGEILNSSLGPPPDIPHPPFSPPPGFFPFETPFTIDIPPLNQLIIHAYPTDPILPSSPLYEVKVAYPVDPIIPGSPFHPVDPISPGDPITPSDPVLPILVNSWGVNFDGIIQEGNTILNRHFIRGVSIF